MNGDGKTQCDAESGKEQHVFVEFTVEPTCTAIGHLYMRCECGHIQSNQNIPALGHDYEVTEVVKPPLAPNKAKRYVRVKRAATL